MLVRAAVQADATAIADIYNQGIADRTPTFERWPRTIEDILTWFDGAHPVLLVEDGGKVIAFGATLSCSNREF